MRELKVTDSEKGQRFDKYLKRKLSAAPASFIYKMLRKKNITLNGKKAAGSELLQAGDAVALYLSEETFALFSGAAEAGSTEKTTAARPAETHGASACLQAYRSIGSRYHGSPVLYEDGDIMLVCKLPGILSQKAEADDESMNEWLLGCLLERGEITAESMREFRPSVVNRLDRNTGGILIMGKTLSGSREMTRLLRTRELHKFYCLVAGGRIEAPGTIEGWIKKDEETNRVIQTDRNDPQAAYSKTVYKPLVKGSALTLVEAELITGRTHQLRAHFALQGWPVAGDRKYGDPKLNRAMADAFGVRDQMLWCTRVVFPAMSGEWERLSGREFLCGAPEVYERAVKEYGNVEFQGTSRVHAGRAHQSHK
ncbi:MAG: RluA family pseudouridine synthase [Lachnospiraceae bacterium]|jgi:23S rRNA pseudouridine955/2504/2580 synthase|nr:RluA family pseudouridine synthase [Lachnospiraceae bacterium]